jgi:hypothetical protein
MEAPVRVIAQHDVLDHGETYNTRETRFAPIREALDQRVPAAYRQKFPEGPGLAVWLV